MRLKLPRSHGRIDRIETQRALFEDQRAMNRIEGRMEVTSDVGRAMNTLPLPKGFDQLSVIDQFGGVDELYEELERLVREGKGQTMLARTEGGLKG